MDTKKVLLVDDDEDVLEQLSAVFKADSRTNVGDLLKLDLEFYVALTQAAKNAVMKLLINTMRPAVLTYAPFFAQFNPPPATVRKHHRDLIKAIRERDSEGAYKIADAYLRKGIETLQATVGAAKPA